jgi:fructokinase
VIVAGPVANYAALVERTVADLILVKASDEDLRLLYPDRDRFEVAGAWAGSGPGLVVVTRGPNGAVVITGQGEPIAVTGEAVQVVDTVG